MKASIGFTAIFFGIVGLSACAAVPTNPPNSSTDKEVRARAIHERLLTLDTHLDTPALVARPGFSILNRNDWRRDFSQVDVPRMVEGGLDGGMWVVYTAQVPEPPKA